jgi:uncharacterized membrane protein
MMGYYDGWSWLWMSAMMLLFWGGVIALAVWGIRTMANPRRQDDSALETLKRRLTAGEISQEDYEKTKRVLQG